MIATILIDGLPATPDDLAHQALVNYGAYTSFRVEGGGVRGLDLHLARLEASAVELFGESPGEAEFRRLLEHIRSKLVSENEKIAGFRPIVGRCVGHFIDAIVDLRRKRNGAVSG